MPLVLQGAFYVVGILFSVYQRNELYVFVDNFLA